MCTTTPGLSLCFYELVGEILKNWVLLHSVSSDNDTRERRRKSKHEIKRLRETKINECVGI
jgi:hypothetical protein